MELQSFIVRDFGSLQDFRSLGWMSYNPLVMMSPKVLESDGLTNLLVSYYDAIHESRASVHVGNDAKIWPEPEIEIGREGRTLKPKELRKALRVIEENYDYLLEEWRGHGK